MKIIPLSEGTFTIDKTKLFVPFDDDSDDLQSRPVGSLLVEIQPFVVITGKDIILLDTGLGFKKNGVLQIHKNLSAHDIQPSAVTKVLLTHLHKDHAGGISMEDKLSSMRSLSFERAQYYIQQRELDFAFEKGFPSFITEELAGLKENKQVVFLTGDSGRIDGYIDYEVSGGHSPFHQVFWIREQDEIVFFGGDEAPQLQQMKNRFVAKYDYNGKRAMELRQQWWEQGNREHWTFLFYHDVKTPLYKKNNNKT
jgi:glyoxylase-like metal-dependent hydrolase (beta-lactamase superfamily II)